MVCIEIVQVKVISTKTKFITIISLIVLSARLWTRWQRQSDLRVCLQQHAYPVGGGWELSNNKGSKQVLLLSHPLNPSIIPICQLRSWVQKRVWKVSFEKTGFESYTYHFYNYSISFYSTVDCKIHFSSWSIYWLLSDSL